MKSINDIIEDNEVWFQIFDAIRIIECGGTHRVLSYKGKVTFDTNMPCYTFWGNTEHCANCVSKKADQNKKNFIKLEYCNNEYYLVIAKPIVLNDESYILELIMNISDQIQNDTENSNIKKYVTDLVNRLEDASTKESFTNLYNKTYMQETYETSIDDCERSKLYMSLLDMNNFKLLNDTYGHAFGDQVLLNISNTLKEIISEHDGIAARFGGDEFGIIFVSEDEDECRRLLETLKNRINSHAYQYHDQTFYANISYGLADVKNTQNFYEAIHIVDKCMYYAKKKDKKADKSAGAPYIPHS